MKRPKIPQNVITFAGIFAVINLLELAIMYVIFSASKGTFVESSAAIGLLTGTSIAIIFWLSTTSQTGKNKQFLEKIDSIVIKTGKIAEMNNAHEKKRKYFVYSQCKRSLEFIVSRMPRIDQCRINLLEKDSHEDKLYIQIDIQNMDQSIDNLKSILYHNNDIMDPDIHERIGRCVQHIQLYQSEKRNVSIFAKGPKGENKLNDVEIQYVLDKLSTQIKKHEDGQ